MSALRDMAVETEKLLPRIMRRMFTLDAAHPANDLTLAQLRLCTILQAGPQTVSALSEELAISVSALTQLADRLERAGLVERVPMLSDRRCRRIQLTEEGARVMELRREMRVKRAEGALARLSPEAREHILDNLRVLLDAAVAAGDATDPLPDLTCDRVAR